MAQVNNSNQQKKRYIFLDTCIIQYAGNSNKSLSEEIIKHLQNLAKEGFSLAISEFTIYENLQGLWGRKAQDAAKLLRIYETKQVSTEVLVIASILQGLYHDEKYENIADGDKIIASTAILENGLILTTNHKDFPHPFFLTERSLPITYTKGHTNSTLDIALYKPHFVLISSRIEHKESN